MALELKLTESPLTPRQNDSNRLREGGNDQRDNASDSSHYDRVWYFQSRPPLQDLRNGPLMLQVIELFAAQPMTSAASDARPLHVVVGRRFVCLQFRAELASL